MEKRFPNPNDNCPICGKPVNSSDCQHFHVFRDDDSVVVRLTNVGTASLLDAGSVWEMYDSTAIELQFYEKEAAKASGIVARWLARGAHLITVVKDPDRFTVFVHIDSDVAGKLAADRLHDLMSAQDDDFIAAFEGVG